MLTSFLDTDLYKFTQQQAAWTLYPDAGAEYRFINRNPERDKFTTKFVDELRGDIEAMAGLVITPPESDYLRSLPFLRREYVSYLTHDYRFDPTQVMVGLDRRNQLQLIIRGPWHQTILWEVPLMALISERYCARYAPVDLDDVVVNLRRKAEIMEACGAEYSDFGTRRRRSDVVQNLVVQTLKEYPGFQGTSNVALAFRYNVPPIGTQAHEWFQAHSVLCGLRHANRYALEAWRSEYGPDLAIALTDTFGTQAFLGDFDDYLANSFDGVRQDSGDPKRFVDEIVAHYRRLDLNPLYKTIVFSNALRADVDVPVLQAYCQGKIGCSFGIGTNLTNDFGPDAPALNMVIKLTKLNGVPVVKLSDDRSKGCGDSDALRVARWTFFNTPLGD